MKNENKSLLIVKPIIIMSKKPDEYIIIPFKRENGTVKIPISHIELAVRKVIFDKDRRMLNEIREFGKV